MRRFEKFIVIDGKLVKLEVKADDFDTEALEIAIEDMVPYLEEHYQYEKWINRDLDFNVIFEEDK